MFNRADVVALQLAGHRVEMFHEECRACGRPSVYRRDEDRYYHQDGAPNQPCWVAISQGLVAAQRESYDSVRGQVA